MKHHKIPAICALVFTLSACGSAGTEDLNVIQDNPYDDIVVDESKSPEEAQEDAEQTAKINRETFNAALLAGDEKQCENIASYDLSFSCKQNALVEKAVLNKDKSICSQMDSTEGKDLCKKEVEKVTD